MADARILVVDDDNLIRQVLVERLEKQGHEVLSASTVAEARAHMAKRPPDFALLDIKLPDGEGTEILRELVEDPDAVAVMMTAHATVKSAVEALRLGARDYLEKPFSYDRLDATVAGLLELTRLRREVRNLRESQPLAGGVIGESAPMRQVMAMVEKVAPAESTTVLIQGETGTGKGIIAHALHRLSPRADGPFINVTCSALAETLMESELFGHEKGAFTDARTQKRGLVELADGGTLFLDEIGELSTRIQGKLLRFLEDHSFRRVGGTKDLTVNLRLVAATNRDLEKEVEAGTFRADLYYRLRVIPIQIPPLRERPDDIPPLTKAFVENYNREFGKRVRQVAPDAMALLRRYPWPGNVRELRNVVERSVLLADEPVLTAEMLPPEVRGTGNGALAGAPTVPLGPEGLDMDQLERTLLVTALERAGGNRTEAGRLLGLSRHQIRNRLQKYGVEE
ncbi:MAG TPA: sigma-54 dependent transcriptional regulator [Longimicrobiales bacterium]|nr:sigma-54 dependent transcriptional regulator [Longimicrobiales bacterium]